MPSHAWPTPDPQWDDLATEPLVGYGVEVDVTDPEILNVLYGPDGEPISYLTDRPVVPFGFHAHTPTPPT